MTGEAVALAALGVMATMVGVLVWLIKKQFDQNDTTIKDSNSASRELASSITKLSIASERQVEAIKQSREEQQVFQERVIAKLDVIDDKADRNFSAVQNINIKHQVVEHQTVKEERVESKS
jgi:hypothetical protein